MRFISSEICMKLHQGAINSEYNNIPVCLFTLTMAVDDLKQMLGRKKIKQTRTSALGASVLVMAQWYEGRLFNHLEGSKSPWNTCRKNAPITLTTTQQLLQVVFSIMRGQQMSWLPAAWLATTDTRGGTCESPSCSSSRPKAATRKMEATSVQLTSCFSL